MSEQSEISPPSPADLAAAAVTVALGPHPGERRVCAFDVRIYASPPDPALPEEVATRYRAVVRGVETGVSAERCAPVGTWALMRALRAGAASLRSHEATPERAS